MKTKILPLVFVVLFFSCQKENEPESKTSLLTAKAWKFIKIETKTDNLPWFDEIPFMPACERDDELLFKTDGSCLYSEGATKCNPMDSDIIDEVRWSFVDNETKIDFDGGVFVIEKLDHTQFIISATETTGSHTSYVKYTLEH